MDGWGSTFDPVTGIVTVAADAPGDWVGQAVLPLWERPNDDGWAQVTRALIHESVHFWHLLGSGFMAHLVDDHWQRVLQFEASGEVLPRSSRVDAYGRRGTRPFSARELNECWARYWDVHIRGPQRIIDEECLSMPAGTPERWDGAYPHVVWEEVMTNGESCQLYGAPYRWMLDRLDADSTLANLAFPFVAFAAFLTEDPVELFVGAIDRLSGDDALVGQLRSNAGAVAHERSLNLAWLVAEPVVLSTLIRPLVLERGDVADVLTTGYDVLQHSALARHPLLGPYATKGAAGNFGVWSANFFPTDTWEVPEYSAMLHDQARAGPQLAQHTFPGQPWYRLTLGALVPPPAVRFDNLTWTAPRVLEVATHAPTDEPYRAQDGETFAADVEGVVERVAKFRLAEVLRERLAAR